MAAPVVETRALGKHFAGVTALEAIDLTVSAGAAVAVFGPNGAGKTTLLRILATLLRPTAGIVRLFDQDIAAAGTALRQRTGFLSHQSMLYPDLTPTQNLEFYARMYGASIGCVPQLIDDVGLTGWAHRPVRTLSRGLEQRCAVARAVLHRPELLLLDEPFTGLDADAATMLTRRLREAHAHATTLVMTTHDLARGFELCEQAIVLVAGRLIWSGPLSSTSPENLLRLYGGRTHDAAPGASMTV